MRTGLSPQRPYRSLADRLDGLVALHGHRIAIQYVADGDPDRDPVEVTFTEFADAARRKAGALRALGVAANDVVAFASPLSEDVYPMMVAVMMAATYAPLNYFLESEALVRILRASGARWLVLAREFADAPDALDKLRSLCAALPYLRLIAFGSGPELAAAADLDAADLREGFSAGAGRAEAADRVVALFHTGGTTGDPKLVPHTEAMYDVMIDECGAGEGTAPGEAIISGLPLFHTSGALQAGLAPLFNGARLVIPSAKGFRDPRTIEHYWRFVRRYEVSIGAGVPTVLAALAIREPERPVPSLKRILAGGAPLAKATIARLRAITGGVEVIEGWGMTETCGFSVMNPHGGAKVGAVGLPFPSVEVEIRQFAGGDRLGERCPTNVIGEVAVRGAIVITRYLDERPQAFTSDGWLRTGDLGRLDEDGYLWITGRAKDLIIRSGHNIDPATIEEPAYQHPDVQLAAAIGRPDKYAGELPVLYVQLKPGATVSEEELLAFVAARVLERAATPKSVRVAQELPLSGPGKISKLQLRRRLVQEVFQEEIESLGLDGLRIEATVVAHAARGELVQLRAEAAEASSRALISAQLNRYAVAHEWVESGRSDAGERK